ncbi:hypothetical protein [Luteibacter yeojuensis]|uniref:Baseplate J-like protein n=1 Tax=Luteibacter yeojuensis TaxID=345309 RepID=A0A7X5QSN6_9GAMM|nr:hypothetical protein [Luteibacter yeojuensis]NID14695.1 hypothetical protein [Luteibacter yeojuensis]
MNSGTQQDERLADALRRGYVVPDEFSLAERIRLILGYAAHVRFATGDGGTAGCWDDALLRDESVVLADMASFPLDQAKQAFAEVWGWADERHLWWRVRQVVSRVDGWCRWLARHETRTAVHVLQATMAAIGNNLRDLLHEAVRSFGWDEPSAREMHPAWRMDAVADRGGSVPRGGRSRRSLLRRLWGALCVSLARLQPIALSQLPPSLANGKHEPAMGLLMAALEIFQASRTEVNRFPERLTDFYFLDILRMRPRRPPEERVYLRFTRDATYAPPVYLPRGTRFVGGKDMHGQGIEFASDHALEVTDNEVAALYSLRMDHDPLISPEREFGYATRALAQEIPLRSPDAAYVGEPSWWPLLGGEAKGSAAGAAHARLGFALVSPMLALKEGDRRVRLLLRLSHPAVDDDNLAALLRREAGARDAAWLADVFARFDAAGMRLHADAFGSTPASPAAQRAEAAWGRAPRTEGDVRLCYLVASCLAQDDADRFKACLGRLFAAWLIAGNEALHPRDTAALRARAAGLLGGGDARAVELDDPLILIYPHEHDEGQGGPDRELIFNRVFRGVWQAEFSVADGWLVPGDVLAVRRTSEGFGWGGCIELSIHLGQEQPPVVSCKPSVHGTACPEQPVLRLTLQTRTRLYAFSLLEQVVLHDITLSTHVAGVRGLVIYNQLGRLDAGKPFQPFGPLPAVGDYCLFGNDELAGKPLRELRLHVLWGRLPGEEGGFAAWYRDYPGSWSASGFQVKPAILRDGQWRSGEGLQSLFHGERHLSPDATLSLPGSDLSLYHRAQASVPEPFAFGTSTRNGFFRLELAGPQAAFGHALYPRLLSETMAGNARSRRAGLVRPLPNEPYTPTVDQVSLDYVASERISLKATTPSSFGKLMHLHPFGYDTPRARPGMDGVPLLPRYVHQGNLYIGLSGTDPCGALSLYFSLRAESAAESWQAPLPATSWAVWSEGEWRELESERVLSDGTMGFLRSGIVAVDLPAGMTRDCPQWPGRLYWIRLSADGVLERLAGLYGIYTQAITATRVHRRGAGDSTLPLAPGSVRTPLQPVGGLLSVQQIGPSFGIAQPETPGMLRVRSAERLRHKDRASTPWDYERLLLDAFPDIFKAKCFVNGEAGQAAVSGGPGGVLVVVVPAPQRGILFHSTDAPHFDAAVLEEMMAYLRERSAPGLRIVVRNAVYEYIQVRCTLRLVNGAHPGAALFRANRAVVEYLSPWHEDGCRASFDWEVRAEAIEAYLRGLDDVEAIGSMSLLHIVRRDDNTYRLYDTGRARAGAPVRMVRPAQSWSLVLPRPRHLIELAGAGASRDEQPTGVGRLEIGGTFIMGGAGR